jgi:ferredoxin-NADP reductase
LQVIDFLVSHEEIRGERVNERAEDVMGSVLELLPGPVAGWLRRSERVTQLVRDVAMIASGVVGPRRPVARRYEAQGDGVVLPGERRLRVKWVKEETVDAVSVGLERPEGFTFEAGQFLTLLLPVDGKELRRSYSLSSAPGEQDALVFTVKRVAGGAGSTWLHRNVKAGATLRVRGPSGSFVYRPREAPGRLVLVGGGSGITPLMSILKTVLAGSPEVPVFLLYANRSAADVIFREELDRLAAQHPGLTVRHVLEQAGGLPCAVGRVSREELAAALGPKPGEARVYLCGPEGMMQSAQGELLSLGLAPEHLLIERFVTVRPRETEGHGQLYRLRVGARQVDVPAGKTLLEAATAAGIDLDFSCTMGGCGACKARLVEGDVVLDEPNCLSEAERAEGLVLTCVGRPRSDVTIERLH